jgi:transglutaminase-like putative cysteine protease
MYRRLLGPLVAAALTAGCAAPTEADDASEATGQDLYTESAMPKEVTRRVKSCFTHDWSQTQFVPSTTTDPWGGSRKIMPVLDPVADGVAALINSVGHLVLRGSAGEGVIQELLVDLKGTAAEQHLADFQVVEMTLCVTSRLITYADTGAAAFLGADRTVELYEGVCREYAGVAVRLLKGVGLKGGFVGGELYDAKGKFLGGHAWNSVSLYGRTFWIEPQDDPVTDPQPIFFDEKP